MNQDRQRVNRHLKPRSHQLSSRSFAMDVNRTSFESPSQNHHDQDHSIPSALFATHSTFGVLDLGASRTVVGSDHVSGILQGLDEPIRQQVTRVKCNITFKFGNQGTLKSSDAMVIPTGPLKLKVAVVPGGTPFLVSNTLMRAIHAQIGCHHQCIRSPWIKEMIPLQLTSRGLFLIDINALAVASWKPLTKFPHGKNAEQQTFVTTSRVQK